MDILTDTPNPAGLTYGFWVDTDHGSTMIEDGDYIDEEKMRVYKRSEYSSSIIKNIIHEKIGKDVVRDLYRILQSQNLTQAQEGDLITRIYPVLGSLGDGFIRASRVIASNTAVAGQYTQARKDYLISKIDEAITKL